MSEKYTVAQIQRLTELNAEYQTINEEFSDVAARNEAFKTVEKQCVKENRKRLNHLLKEKHMSLTMQVEKDMTTWLTEKADFTKVATPIIINSEQLDKMTITKGHALRKQVFWVDNKHCMRPMLAPNLYLVMRDINKITNEPVRIFECGSCFRKESQGSKHMNEFTMLNMVELAGTKEGNQMERLEGFAHDAMAAVGIDKYELVKETSDVYGETLDIEVDGVEIASGAFGPHPLDSRWGIFDTWVGIGFGVERIAMLKGEYRTIKRAGKSITYIDGIPLKL